MAYNQKYENVKPMWYNPVTGEASHEKIENASYFHSSSEYYFYRRLLSYCAHLDIDVRCQSTISFSDTTWKVDFKLSTHPDNKATCSKLASLCNVINGSHFDSLSSLYIEYKGVQDSNFVGKMSSLVSYHPTLAKTIILVSKYTSAFGCRHLNKEIIGFICKPIVSVEDFGAVFTKVF